MRRGFDGDGGTEGGKREGGGSVQVLTADVPDTLVRPLIAPEASLSSAVLF